MSDTLTAQQQLVLDELRAMLASKDVARQQIDNKAATILQVGGLVVAITGAIGVSTFINQTTSLWVLGGVVFVLLLFLGMLVSAILAWRPSLYSVPGTSDWDELYRDYIYQELDACYAQMISNLTNSINKNHKYNEGKQRYVQVAGWLFVAQVAGILILAGVAAIYG